MHHPVSDARTHQEPSSIVLRFTLHLMPPKLLSRPLYHPFPQGHHSLRYLFLERVASATLRAELSKLDAKTARPSCPVIRRAARTAPTLQQGQQTSAAERSLLRDHDEPDASGHVTRAPWTRPTTDLLERRIFIRINCTYLVDRHPPSILRRAWLRAVNIPDAPKQRLDLLMQIGDDRHSAH